MQNDEMKNCSIENNGRKWQFWFLVSFSLLLVVTFVWYLPLRFQYKFLTGGDHKEMAGHEMKNMMQANGHMAPSLFHEEEEIKEGLAVNLNVAPVPVLADTLAKLDFFVNEKPANTPVPISSLEIAHTKVMHVIGVRSDLNEFFHIHPAPTPQEGVFSVQHIFTKPGSYKLWSEVKKDGMNHSFGHPVFNVEGSGERENKQVSFGRNAIVGNYQVSLQLQEPVAKGHEHNLSFDIHTLTGKEVEVEDYLGAPMHVVIIKDDLTQFIHAHPEGVGENHHGFLQFFPQAKANGVEDHEVSPRVDETIKFLVTFPEAGLYNVFAQFRPQGTDLAQDEALHASFWIKVQEKQTMSAAGSWWLLLIVSLIAITVLGFSVRKFLQVRK